MLKDTTEVYIWVTDFFGEEEMVSLTLEEHNEQLKVKHDPQVKFIGKFIKAA